MRGGSDCSVLLGCVMTWWSVLVPWPTILLDVSTGVMLGADAKFTLASHSSLGDTCGTSELCAVIVEELFKAAFVNMNTDDEAGITPSLVRLRTDSEEPEELGREFGREFGLDNTGDPISGAL